MKLADEVRVVDADTHMTERHDLFTSRAPKGYEDRVPLVQVIDGLPMWTLEGVPLGPARPGGVIDLQGDKHAFEETKKHGIDWVHQGAWDWEYRLGVMDECGIHAQIVYPNAVGIGGQNLANATQDPAEAIPFHSAYNRSPVSVPIAFRPGARTTAAAG